MTSFPSKIRKFILKFRTIILNLKFLFGTHAPRDVLFFYLHGELFNRTIYERYRNQMEEFEVNKNTLELTKNWFTGNIPFWISAFIDVGLVHKKEIKALEIGCWEGLSSYFILHSLPQCKLTCVDTWQGADEHKNIKYSSANEVSASEKLFDKNLKCFQSRYMKFKGTSLSFFNASNEPNSFDLIYVDGSHYCDDVCIDALKAFELLKNGGIMIFDDYFWEYYKNNMDNPAAAINLFLKLKVGRYKIIRVYYQIIIQKTCKSMIR